LGPVFRAYEPERDRLVAVKVFRLDLPPERVHQLVGEFERLIDVGLRHPAIAAPVATGLDGVVAYLAQNYFSGDSLDIVIRERGPLPLAEALPVVRQLAQALDSAAERLVEHGALHPRDVLLSSEGTCIVGLGITRALERIGAAVPIRRPYTAPERVEGAAWDHRADIFSLAAVVHEMLWGRRVVGTGLQAIDAMTPLPGTHLMALQTVFSRALAEQAIDRFSTATEFVESLERAAGAEVSAPEPERLRVVEPQRVMPVAELLLPLEDEIALVEPELSEPELPDPVLRLREPDSAFPIPVEPPEPQELLEPLEPLEPSFRPPEPVKAPEPTPLFLASTPAYSPSLPASSSPLVWPIGVACMVGVAIGFGVGYTVGIRDRASVGQATRERAAAPAAPAAVAPSRDFTESTVGAQPTAAPQAGSEARLPPEEAPVAPFSGRVVVQSMPAGARVFVDGRDRGSTPATVTDLGRGEHRLRIVRDGYTAAERRIVLSSSRPSSSLIVPLAKTPVSPKPNVRQSADAAPASPKPGTRPSAEAGLASPKPAATAVAEVGSLLIESRPTGANVFMDGRAVGKTPANLPEVKAGDHAVRLELTGHRQWTTSFKVMGGTPNRIGASLEKID
jgi:serine/threonine-protein kinase